MREVRETERREEKLRALCTVACESGGTSEVRDELFLVDYLGPGKGYRVTRSESTGDDDGAGADSGKLERLQRLVAVPENLAVLRKLRTYSILMCTLPIFAFYATEWVFAFHPWRIALSGGAAVVVANLIIVAYIRMAIAEDGGSWASVGTDWPSEGSAETKKEQ